MSTYVYCVESGQEPLLTFDGAVSGFKVTKIIYNFANDTNGYIGYLPSDKSIYVVFRGSLTNANHQTDYTLNKISYDCPSVYGSCQVHAGFYAAEKSVI